VATGTPYGPAVNRPFLSLAPTAQQVLHVAAPASFFATATVRLLSDEMRGAVES
jgi:hypothetical protein